MDESNNFDPNKNYSSKNCKPGTAGEVPGCFSDRAHSLQKYIVNNWKVDAPEQELPLIMSR